MLLRYFDDLAPREVASRLGVPVETVRTRLRRGLERLRTALDERHGGDRSAWAGGLVPLLPRPQGPAVPWGPALVAGLAAAAAAGVLLVWRLRTPADSESAPPVVAAAPAAAAPDRSSRHARRPPRRRRAPPPPPLPSS